MSHLHAVRTAFDRAAQRYDAAATVQREIGRRLAALMRAQPSSRPVERILDAGSGTGHGLQLLRAIHPAAECIAVDFAPAMLAGIAPSQHALRICADVQQLPIGTGRIDAIWSSLALQWCDPQRAFEEFARVLPAGGMAWIATLGPQTLQELRMAFRSVDDAEHVLRFRCAEVWHAAAEAAGLRCVALKQERTQVLGKGLRDILGHLRGIGAHRVPGNTRSPLTRSQWRTLEHAYEPHRRDDGQLPATYDVILLALQRS